MSNPRKESKIYSIKTFGCYANEVDSDVISATLDVLGFKELKILKFKNEVGEINYILKNSDLLIVNSCSVRQKSEDKVYGLGKIISEYKKKRKKKAQVFLTGCIVGSVLGERKRFSLEDLKKKTRNYDDYLLPSDTTGLLNLLKEHGLIEKSKFLKKSVERKKHKGEKHAFVNVSYGCDNFCSYCVVPYSRGREISRKKEDILKEINCLIKNRVSEITLCGQNVNSWGLSKSEKFKIRSGSTEKLPFAYLLRKIHKIKEITKIDFISSNPFDFTQDLINIFRLPKISNYIHIAVQSGNNKILKDMNRRHTVEEFIDLIKRIKKIKPSIEIGTDLIVGFPGETRKQFMDTVNLVKKIKFNVAFISMYSPRKGTYAQINLRDNIPLREKKWRHMFIAKVWKETKKDIKE